MLALLLSVLFSFATAQDSYATSLYLWASTSVNEAVDAAQPTALINVAVVESSSTANISTDDEGRSAPTAIMAGSIDSAPPPPAASTIAISDRGSDAGFLTSLLPSAAASSTTASQTTMIPKTLLVSSPRAANTTASSTYVPTTLETLSSTSIPPAATATLPAASTFTASFQKRRTIGIALGTTFGALAVVTAGFLFFLLARRRRQLRQQRASTAAHRRTRSDDTARALTTDFFPAAPRSSQHTRRSSAQTPRRSGRFTRSGNPLSPASHATISAGLPSDAAATAGTSTHASSVYPATDPRWSSAPFDDMSAALASPPPVVMRQSGFDVPSPFSASETSLPEGLGRLNRWLLENRRRSRTSDPPALSPLAPPPQRLSQQHMGQRQGPAEQSPGGGSGVSSRDGSLPVQLDPNEDHTFGRRSEG
jgi:hypothetical protein